MNQSLTTAEQILILLAMLGGLSLVLLIGGAIADWIDHIMEQSK